MTSPRQQRVAGRTGPEKRSLLRGGGLRSWFEPPLQIPALLLVTAGAALAQDVSTSVPDTPPSAAAARRVFSDTLPNGIGRIGPFDILPQVSVVTYYDDNINNTSANPLDDVVITISPGVLASAVDRIGTEVDKTFTIGYTPSFQIYTDHSEYTSFNQAGSVAGTLYLNRLTLGFTQNVVDQSSPSADVGGRLDSRTANTLLTSRYELGAKTSTDINARYSLNDNSGYSSSQELSNDDWINYQIGHRTQVGLGLVFGWVDVEDGVDQTYQQVRARASYDISEKLAASLSAGGEFRQYDSDVDGTMNPVWDLSATYAPREGTTVSLTAYQRYTSSALSGDQNYLSSGVDLGFFQALGDRFRFSLGGAYYHADYEATTATVLVDRRDDVYRIRIGLDVTLRQNWSAGIFYSHDANTSSEAAYSYDKNQVGVQTSWQF